MSRPLRGRAPAHAASRALVLALALLPLACNSDEVTATDAGDDDTDLEGMPLGGPARGISILTVEANQGTSIFLSEGQEYVGAEDRNAYLVSQRDTLVRFQHRIEDPEAWVPRELVGRLHIYPPGVDPDSDSDEVSIRERRFFVEADSDPRNITTNFFFSLLADEARPGTRFWLELREGDPELEASEAVQDLSAGVVTAPEQPAPFGFETAPLEMKVMIVPVDYYGVEPPRLAAPTAEDLQLFHDDLLQQNPVQTIDIQIRDEPLVYEEQLTALGALLGPTRALKVADQAPANVYYHALVDVGGSSVGMVAGIANLTDASKESGDNRVAATVFHKYTQPDDEETGEPGETFPPTASSRTWVHEIGHNQGLRHVYCPGADSAGPDPDYPYEDGKIGVYGFGIRNFHMYTPGAAHDYMSYCGNSWVSDWTWNKTFERIETLTSWDYEAPSSTGERVPILVGTLFADGSEDWWVYESAPPGLPNSAEQIELRRESQVLARAYASQAVLSDGQTRVLSFALPEGGAGVEGVDQIVRVDHRGQRHEVAPAAVHEGRSFAARNRARVRAR